MSGICGVIKLDGSPVDPETPRRMAEAAPHRGPDGIAYHVTPSAGLSHLALDITPESLREKQPLVEGNLVLVADARIDNRGELIRELRLSADSPTDADLIMAAYRRWGEGCPPHLVGDFAFAVWDEGRGRLFAARDPMAMRAFYYRMEPRRFLFGTEAKQILAAPDVPRRVFEPAVAAHLAGPYGLPEWSFYEGISQLAPAHAMAVDGRGRRVWRFWDAEEEAGGVEYSSEEEYVERFFEVFSEAVRCRMRSAKPVGILLSGGMDSGSVASVGGRLLRGGALVGHPGFRAYSWAFEELAGADERHLSATIPRRYGFPVTDVPADDEWPLKGYPAHGPDEDAPLIWTYEPLHERTLAKARSDGMGLMLSGDRGDQMVGEWVFDHAGLLLSGRFGALWDELREHARWYGTSAGRVAVGQLIKPLLLGMWPGSGEWATKARSLLRRSGPSPVPYLEWVRPEFAERVGLTEIIAESEPASSIKEPARRMRYGRIFSPAIARLIANDERRWSRFGVGFADPWSDRRLAEFVLATPQWMIQRAGEPKRIARRAMRGVMPEEVRRHAGGITAGSLADRGFKERAKATVWDLITDSQAAARGYVDEKVLRDNYESFLRGERRNHDFWWALTLEMWLRRYWN